MYLFLCGCIAGGGCKTIKGTLRSGVDVQMRTNKDNKRGRLSKAEKQSFK